MNDIATSTSTEIEKVPTEEEIAALADKAGSSPSALLRGTLTKFVDDVCEQVRQEDNYITELKKVALNAAQSGQLKSNELIALITSATSNKNDLVSKVISPTMGMLTAAQQNEMNERKEAMREKERTQQPSSIRAVSDMAPSDVLVGLQALFTQATIATKRQQVEKQKDQ